MQFSRNLVLIWLSEPSRHRCIGLSVIETVIDTVIAPSVCSRLSSLKFHSVSIVMASLSIVRNCRSPEFEMFFLTVVIIDGRLVLFFEYIHFYLPSNVQWQSRIICLSILSPTIHRSPSPPRKWKRLPQLNPCHLRRLRSEEEEQEQEEEEHGNWTRLSIIQLLSIPPLFATDQNDNNNNNNNSGRVEEGPTSLMGNLTLPGRMDWILMKHSLFDFF